MPRCRRWCGCYDRGGEWPSWCRRPDVLRCACCRRAARGSSVTTRSATCSSSWAWSGCAPRAPAPFSGCAARSREHVSTLGVVLVALAIAVGLVGIVVPVLPGGLLVFAAIAVWAIVEHTAVAWVTLGVAAALFVTAEVVKYLWPMRRMREIGRAHV